MCIGTSHIVTTERATGTDQPADPTDADVAAASVADILGGKLLQNFGALQDALSQQLASTTRKQFEALTESLSSSVKAMAAQGLEVIQQGVLKLLTANRAQASPADEPFVQLPACDQQHIEQAERVQASKPQHTTDAAPAQAEHLNAKQLVAEHQGLASVAAVPASCMAQGQLDSHKQQRRAYRGPERQSNHQKLALHAQSQQQALAKLVSAATLGPQAARGAAERPESRHLCGQVRCLCALNCMRCV